MSIDREELKKAAIHNVSAEHYYDLLDTIDETSDEELAAIAGLDLETLTEGA